MNSRVILAAAENGALPDGKVGGIGDVITYLPVALADIGWQPTVITPSYGRLHALPGAKKLGSLDVAFGGSTNRTDIYRAAGADARIEHVVLDHARLSGTNTGSIYHDDGPERPFATDATKFAFFSAAVATYVCRLNVPPDALHLHDWHLGLVLALREFDSRYAPLRHIHTAFTIHNLALQGIRPLHGDASSLTTWYPDLDYRKDAVADPRYADCVNPMAAGIRLADKVSTVSPTYAKEIRRANDPKRGFSGGEGLEKDLQNAFKQKRLIGILNGCSYPKKKPRRPGWQRLLNDIESALSAWCSKNSPEPWIHAAAADRLKGLSGKRPPNVLVSIGRLTPQKVALFLQQTGANSNALETIVDDLGDGGVFIMLGSGDRQIEQRLATIEMRRQNFVFLCGYSDSLAELLYAAGDLFLMPSSFEPCGISQMLAMRAGQPCVVHAAGGLKDTVAEGKTGFLFNGRSPTAQAAQFVTAVRRALHVKTTDAERWTSIRKQAAAARFSWDVAARQYESSLYDHA